MKFSELQAGDHARIVRFDESMDHCYRHKLLSMGLTPKTEFIFIRKAPLGDPIQIEVRGFSLVLRKKEIDGLVIEKI
jgi:ferrous iron transport protein A